MSSYDGFALDTEVDKPAANPADTDVRRVVILIHGSGPLDLNENLSRISAPGTTNYFFADISGALTAKGFTVVRYNKRSFQIRKRAKEDPSFAGGPVLQAFRENPLKSVIDDARHYVDWAGARFPHADIYLLGHGEGAYVALQVAQSTSAVKGVGLIGFDPETMDATLLEQYVYRSLWIFDALDTNKDGFLEESELSGTDYLQKRIGNQFKRLDLNGDDKIDRSEFMAGNFANLLLDDPSQDVFRAQELQYPRPGKILSNLTIDVSFFQGEWDTQAPAYYAKGVQLMNKAQWGKQNFHFRFFPKLGDALDPRADEHDLVFHNADPAALKAMAEDLDARWR